MKLKTSSAKLQAPTSKPSLMERRREVRERILDSLYTNKYRLLGYEGEEPDAKLAALASHVGWLAALQGVGGVDAAVVQDKLQTIAAYAAGWVHELTGDAAATERMIREERLRQMRLLASGDILFDCAAVTVDPLRKLRVLIEELGEVAKAVDLLEEHPMIQARRDHLVDEVTQVAAVAVAWLEAISMAANAPGGAGNGARDGNNGKPGRNGV